MDAFETLQIRAHDGVMLGARRFPAAGPRRAVVVIHGATATPQRYYTRFAAYLASVGFDVITYDYRGVGESRPESLRGYEATMLQWGREDWGGVMAWLDARYPGEPLLAVCHSFGGQALGLAPEARMLDGAVTVGAQFGYVGHFAFLRRLQLHVVWNLLVPTSNAIWGYWPGWTGIGADLPRGVALEWSRWCRSPNYLVDHVPGAGEAFAALDFPVVVYAITDDHAFGPLPAIDAFVQRLPSRIVDRRRLHPGDVGATRIGHFGFFREHFADTLWVETAEVLGEQAREARRRNAEAV